MLSHRRFFICPAHFSNAFAACDKDGRVMLNSVQSTAVRPSSSRSRRFRGVDSSPVSTADGQEIVAVLAEPFQTRYGEDASFIGEYGSRQHRLEQPILEELDETSGDLASDDVSDFACTTDI